MYPRNEDQLKALKFACQSVARIAIGGIAPRSQEEKNKEKLKYDTLIEKYRNNHIESEDQENLRLFENEEAEGINSEFQ